MPGSPSTNQKIFTQWSVESGSKWPIRSLSNDSETSNQKQTVTVNQNADATEQSESSKYMLWTHTVFTSMIVFYFVIEHYFLILE